ncbi:hypothetical protein BDZ94DRAFT_1311068 [Collybia nuda]|uniref:Smr domain-containing protein n=1 Tax=Collybia nuda TaxID=64659 RepID=A0A9P6CCS8_9AGAR|nr:hypothetical protein BDZ94DRAFT_1311068 [Collybia nuda]
MSINTIFQSLHNLLWRSPPSEPPQQRDQKSEYSPESSPEPDTHDISPLDEIVLGKSSDSKLRFQANLERIQMVEKFKRSRDSLQSQSDRVSAKKSAMVHKRSMESLNKQASERIFSENNKRIRPGIIDLHSLHVDEAKNYTDLAIQEATDRGEAKIRLIVGQGRHSEGGMPKLKPAIENHLKRRQIVAKSDPKNPGILIVQLVQSGESNLL